MPLLAINHHYYRPSGPGRGIYPTSPTLMASNIAQLRAHGWNFGGEREIAAYLAGENNERTCIITFDDGLKEQMHALADLEALGVPVMFFASTAPVIEQRVLDVHKLHLIRAVTTDEELSIRLKQRFTMDRHTFDDAALAEQYPYDAIISCRVKYFLNFVLDPALRDPWVSELFTELHGDERAASQQLYMSRDDWRTLAAKGCLGTHGHRHAPLATLTNAGIDDDIAQSIAALHEATGKQPIGIAYPYGGESAVSQVVYRSAIAHGLTYGFTMRRAINTNPPALDAALQLNRIDVNDLPSFIA